MKRPILVSLLLFALVPGAFAKAPNREEESKKDPKIKEPKAKELKAEASGPASKAVTGEIVNSIADEMNRAMQELEINGNRPYHISYKITEVEVNEVSASLGQVTSRHNRHFVNLEARVRVGKPDFDNGNYVVPQAEELDGTAAISLPLEATPRIARRATWLVTDTAFKEALIQFRAKIEARKAGSTHITDAPSWTAEKPVISKDPVLVAPLETLDDLETRVKNVSAVFRDQPLLRDSHVAVTSYLERRWYLTTDCSAQSVTSTKQGDLQLGAAPAAASAACTNVTDTRRASGVVIDASAQADDGQLIGNYFLRYGHTAKDLPTEDELKAESKKLTESIAQIAKAPVIDRYSGPVLFEGEGAVGLLRFALAPHLGGTPVPEGLSPQEARAFGGALTDKVGLRVLSTNLSIVDDPTAREGGGKALIGGYKIDDEGVAAQKVTVVKDGMLKTLLTSRTPSARNQTSNGHARRTTEGGAFHGSATNLFLQGRGGVSRKTLEQQLVAAARAEGLKYGLVIRRFDDAAVTGAPEFTRRELVQMIKSTDQQLLPPALVAYRIYPNGKEELVRGVQLGEIPIRAWKDVIGVGKDLTVYNFLAAPENQLQLKLTGGTDDGFVPSSGIESSVITPDLLLKEIDVVNPALGQRSMPIVPRPTK